jgi:hypothetical protein
MSINYKGYQWFWFVGLLSFEAIHGISRVVRLVPDKLATAIVINKENLPDPEDDGSFLIDLVLKLVHSYLEQTKQTNLDNLTAADHEGCEYVNAMKRNHKFSDVLTFLANRLTKFKSKLGQRNQESINNFAWEILRLCDTILAFCTIYLDFVHPMLISIRRERIVNEVRKNELAEKVEQELQSKRYLLCNEFNSTVTENEN